MSGTVHEYHHWTLDTQALHTAMFDAENNH